MSDLPGSNSDTDTFLSWHRNARENLNSLEHIMSELHQAKLLFDENLHRESPLKAEFYDLHNKAKNANDLFQEK